MTDRLTDNHLAYIERWYGGEGDDLNPLVLALVAEVRERRAQVERLTDDLAHAKAKAAQARADANELFRRGAGASCRPHPSRGGRPWVT